MLKQSNKYDSTHTVSDLGSIIVNVDFNYLVATCSTEVNAEHMLYLKQ